MKKRIPTYPLSLLARSGAAALDVFLLSERAEDPEATFGVPYRTTYYGVGMCTRGRAELSADLEDYRVESRAVIAMSPQTIKQWRFMSRDFQTQTVFFTRAFFVHQNALDPDSLPFFEPGGRHVWRLSQAHEQTILQSLSSLKQRYGASHPYRDEILKALISALLYELMALYPTEPSAEDTPGQRGRQLTAEFKKLVTRHCTVERGVAFYAHKLFVTPRHLSATVRDTTGKTAGEWIEEAVVLEARVLLSDATLSVAQVAEALHFPDQSTFGKFFKKVAGQSPLSYRQSRKAPHPTF